jgi:thiamine biosynthesis lipoprotein
MLYRFAFRAMASPCELQLHGDSRDAVEAAARAATAEVLRIERKYSRYRDDSITARINASAGSEEGVLLDAESAALIDFAETAFEQSGGAFDISSGVLREVWDFRSGRVPSREEVERVLERVGWQRVRWQGGRLRLAAGQQIDFGGFGKEYAADRAAQVCREHGVRSGLVDLSGDIAVVGPHPDASPWVVGVRSPRADGPGEAAASVALDRGGIATSGDYQRCMVVGGRRYAHILDPRTGWPVEGLTSVSVIAPQCLVAGAASTIAMLFGRQGGAWLDGLGLPNLRIDAEGRMSGTLAPDDADYSAPSRRSPGSRATSISPGSTIT